MKCLNPLCDYEKTHVINSRRTEQGEKILRRRHCPKCSKRFTSVEMLIHFNYREEHKPIPVPYIKK